MQEDCDEVLNLYKSALYVYDIFLFVNLTKNINFENTTKSGRQIVFRTINDIK
jgi:hypothetical protein